jgi:hypothetical protein
MCILKGNICLAVLLLSNITFKLDEIYATDIKEPLDCNHPKSGKSGVAKMITMIQVMSYCETRVFWDTTQRSLVDGNHFTKQSDYKRIHYAKSCILFEMPDLVG